MSDQISIMKLKADGITCISCAEDMEKILGDKDGIIDVSVSYFDDTVEIKYDPDLINRKTVYVTVRKIGIPLKIVSES